MHCVLGNYFTYFFNLYFLYDFLQRVGIAAYAMQSAVLAIVNPPVCLSVCHTLALCQNDSSSIMRSSQEDSPMTLVSSCLTSARNAKGNIGSEAPNERGIGKIGNF